jgi:hypothetical protein
VDIGGEVPTNTGKALAEHARGDVDTVDGSR